MARRTGVVLIAILALAAGMLLPSAGGVIGSDTGPDPAGDPPSVLPAEEFENVLLAGAAVMDGRVTTTDTGDGDASIPPSPAALSFAAGSIGETLGHVPPGVPDLPMAYPAEEEPDGNRWLPHHGLWPLPLYVIGWYFWHPAGAPAIGATFVGLAILILLDDWLSHAMGIRTPGDIAFDWLMGRRTFRRMYIRLWWIVYR